MNSLWLANTCLSWSSYLINCHFLNSKSFSTQVTLHLPRSLFLTILPQATRASALISHRSQFMYLSLKLACAPDNKHPNFLSQCNVYAGSKIQTAEKRKGNKNAYSSFSNTVYVQHIISMPRDWCQFWRNGKTRRGTGKSKREAMIRMLCLPTWQEGGFWFAEVLSQLLVCIQHSSNAWLNYMDMLIISLLYFSVAKTMRRENCKNISYFLKCQGSPATLWLIWLTF